MPQPQGEQKKDPAPSRIAVPVGPGELMDKITILEIKAARMDDEEKLAHVVHELDALMAVRRQSVVSSAGLDALVAALRSVNETLWDIEDDIRAHEARGDFGESFIKLARSVYHRNDKRAVLKKEINQLLNSDIVEEKSYRDYS